MKNGKGRLKKVSNEKRKHQWLFVTTGIHWRYVFEERERGSKAFKDEL